jgi:hypothetical protein
VKEGGLGGAQEWNRRIKLIHARASVGKHNGRDQFEELVMVEGEHGYFRGWVVCGLDSYCSTQRLVCIFLTYFPYFEKIKEGL